MNKPIDLTNVVLKTERLVLRPFEEKDLNDLYEYAKVEGVGEAAGWPHHKDINDSKMILIMFIEEKKTFAITYNGKVIGSLGVEKYSEKEFPEFDNMSAREIGYVISKDYWGMGIATEACKAVVDYCFNELKLDMLFCGHFLENLKSYNVQSKCGFNHYKIIKYKTSTGEEKESYTSILKKEDYFNK